MSSESIVLEIETEYYKEHKIEKSISWFNFQHFTTQLTQHIQQTKLKLTLKWFNFQLFCLIISWYLSSSLTNNLAKILLNTVDSPISITVIQFFLVAMIGFLFLIFNNDNKKRQEDLSEVYDKKNKDNTVDNKIISLFQYHPSILKIAIPLALFQIFTHLFNSMALNLIPVSLVFTFKALSPIFTIVFNMLLFQKQYPTLIFLSLIPITLGVLLFCLGEIEFKLNGFLYSIISSLIYVLQTIYTKHKIEKKNELSNLQILSYTSLFSFLFLTPYWLLMEWSLILNFQLNMSFCGLFLLKATCQFFQAYLSFSILNLTDTLSFTILNLLKRMVVILLAMLTFNQPFTYQQSIALLLTFFGLYLYDLSKKRC
ncbi:TPT-domain-containing protein [Neoconidiobolus thromboides FSU 785]|nr:TPT-domain-containing protein [Neoconidiobolus thromboides FSU 785]